MESNSQTNHTAAAPATTQSQLPTSTPKRLHRHKLSVLLFFLILGIIVSVVDITFLSDVLGRLLDLDNTAAIAMSAVIGLAAMVMLMGFHGYMVAHSGKQPWYKNFEIILWFILGIVLLVLRLISANFIEVDSSEGIVQIFGISIRAVDFIIGPIMFIFYLGAGLLAKYCVENIFDSEGWDEFWAKRQAKKAEREKLRQEALAKRNSAKAQAEKQKKRALAKMAGKKEKDGYYNAVKRYKQLEHNIHKLHDEITNYLVNLETKQDELRQTKESGDRLLDSIEQSRIGLQNKIALLIHAKHPENSVNNLKAIIKEYNDEQIQNQ